MGEPLKQIRMDSKTVYEDQRAALQAWYDAQGAKDRVELKECAGKAPGEVSDMDGLKSLAKDYATCVEGGKASAHGTIILKGGYIINAQPSDYDAEGNELTDDTPPKNGAVGAAVAELQFKLPIYKGAKAHVALFGNVAFAWSQSYTTIEKQQGDTWPVKEPTNSIGEISNLNGGAEAGFGDPETLQVTGHLAIGASYDLDQKLGDGQSNEQASIKYDTVAGYIYIYGLQGRLAFAALDGDLTLEGVITHGSPVEITLDKGYEGGKGSATDTTVTLQYKVHSSTTVTLRYHRLDFDLIEEGGTGQSVALGAKHDFRKKTYDGKPGEGLVISEQIRLAEGPPAKSSGSEVFTDGTWYLNRRWAGQFGAVYSSRETKTPDPAPSDLDDGNPPSGKGTGFLGFRAGAIVSPSESTTIFLGGEYLCAKFDERDGHCISGVFVQGVLAF